MSKNLTQMVIDTPDGFKMADEMVTLAIINHYTTMRRLHKEDVTMYSKESFKYVPFLLVFHKKKMNKVRYMSTEWQERESASIDSYINSSEFHHRSLARLRRLEKFIKKCVEVQIKFELSLSDYEYIRLWCESPDSRHTIYNASLY